MTFDWRTRSEVGRRASRGEEIRCSICGKTLPWKNARCSTCFPVNEDYREPNESDFSDRLDPDVAEEDDYGEESEP